MSLSTIFGAYNYKKLVSPKRFITKALVAPFSANSEYLCWHNQKIGLVTRTPIKGTMVLTHIAPGVLMSDDVLIYEGAQMPLLGDIEEVQPMSDELKNRVFLHRDVKPPLKIVVSHEYASTGSLVKDGVILATVKRYTLSFGECLRCSAWFIDQNSQMSIGQDNKLWAGPFHIPLFSDMSAAHHLWEECYAHGDHVCHASIAGLVKEKAEIDKLNATKELRKPNIDSNTPAAVVESSVPKVKPEMKKLSSTRSIGSDEQKKPFRVSNRVGRGGRQFSRTRDPISPVKLREYVDDQEFFQEPSEPIVVPKGMSVVEFMMTKSKPDERVVLESERRFAARPKTASIPAPKDKRAEEEDLARALALSTMDEPYSPPEGAATPGKSILRKFDSQSLITDPFIFENRGAEDYESNYDRLERQLVNLLSKAHVTGSQNFMDVVSAMSKFMADLDERVEATIAKPSIDDEYDEPDSLSFLKPKPEPPAISQEPEPVWTSSGWGPTKRDDSDDEKPADSFNDVS